MSATPTDDLERRLAELLPAAQEPLGAWAREAGPGADHASGRPGRRRALVAVAATVALVGAGVGVVATRGGDDAETGAPVVVADDPTTTSAPDLPATTAADPDPDAGPAPIVGPSAPAGERTAVVGHRDGFAAIVTHADGTTVFRSSPDGATWAEHAVDLAGTVDTLVSDGSTLTAVGVQGEFGSDRLPSAWRSTDDGATWTGGPMPLPDLPAIDDSLLSIGNVAVAAGDGGVLVTGVAYRWLDLFALVERQTGQPFPEGAAISADGTTITVTPEDGEPFTVDASGVDARVANLTDPVEVGVTWVLGVDGSWATAVDPFGAHPGAATWGPAGYLVWALGQLWSSEDGTTWTEVPAPGGLDRSALANLPGLASDGRRYLLVGLESDDSGEHPVAATSSDLRTWEVERLPAEGSLVLPLRVIGGGAGFVSVTTAWASADPADRPPVVVERDGRLLTLDRAGQVVTVVDVATGEELLRWEGDLDHMPADVFAFVDGEVRYLDPETGAVVFRIGFDEMNHAVSVSDAAAETAAPPDQDVLLWSADGLHWEQHPLGDSTHVPTQLAVSDEEHLLLPGTPPAA